MLQELRILAASHSRPEQCPGADANAAGVHHNVCVKTLCSLCSRSPADVGGLNSQEDNRGALETMCFNRDRLRTCSDSWSSNVAAGPAPSPCSARGRLFAKSYCVLRLSVISSTRQRNSSCESIYLIVLKWAFCPLVSVPHGRSPSK